VSNLAHQVLTHAASLPEGASLSAKALLHLGSRAAVDQALSRLARSGELLRAGRGVYVLPVKGKFGARAPEVAKVVQEWATQRGETVVGNGATAANALGLTTQVPVRQVFLTSGRSRKLKLGAQTVELKHAPPWQLLYPGQAAGEVIRSLAWVGPLGLRSGPRQAEAASCRHPNCRPSRARARACPPGSPARSAPGAPCLSSSQLPREDQREALLVAASPSTHTTRQCLESSALPASRGNRAAQAAGQFASASSTRRAKRS
jgi:hypothetical protein